MTLYFDSSALVKAFIREDGSDRVADLLASDEAPACSRLGYVECLSAFARARREGRAIEALEKSATNEFQRGWSHLMVIEVDEPVMSRAGRLVHTLPLRGADAIHLASAQSLPREAEQVKFVCWDRRLWDAARALALQVIPELPP